MSHAVEKTIGRQLIAQALERSGFAPAHHVLHQLRVDADLSIHELAKLSELSYTGIRSTEHGLQSPTRKHVDAICQSLGRCGVLVSVVGAGHGLDRCLYLRLTDPDSDQIVDADNMVPTPDP